MTDKKQAVTISTPVGRLVFHSLWEKDVFTDERGREAEPSYKATLAFDWDDLKEFEDEVVKVAIDFFGEEAADDYDNGEIHSPIRDGDEMAEDRRKREKNGDAFEGLAVVGMKTIYNRNGEDAPGGIYVCGADAKELDFAARDVIYAGCYGVASVTLNPYQGIGGGKPGVSLYLNGFQFVKEGDRLRGQDPSALFSPMMGAKSEGKGRKGRGSK